MRQNVQNGNAQSEAEAAETPVEKLLRLFGPAKAAEIAGLSESGVRKWNRRRATGGCGGLVPARYQMAYLTAAKAAGLELTAEDFMFEARP